MEYEVEDAGETAVDAGPEAAVEQQSQAEQEPTMVPVTALQAERRERQQLQEQNKMLQDHMSLIQSNQRPQQQEKVDEYAGMADDDVLTVGEAKKFLGNIQKNYQTSVEELRVQQKYRDYDDVVTKYLPEVIQKNPALKSTLQNDPQKYELAYYLAKQSDSYREKHKEVKKSAEAKRIVENGHRAGSLSAVGSTSSMSQVSNMKNMSDADFMKMANKNLGRF